MPLTKRALSSYPIFISLLSHQSRQGILKEEGFLVVVVVVVQ